MNMNLSSTLAIRWWSERGRPPGVALIEETPALPPPLPPLGVLERQRFDYAGLEAAMAFADKAIRTARRNLAVLATPPSPPAGSGSAGSVLHSADGDDEIDEVDIAVSNADAAPGSER